MCIVDSLLYDIYRTTYNFPGGNNNQAGQIFQEKYL